MADCPRSSNPVGFDFTVVTREALTTIVRAGRGKWRFELPIYVYQCSEGPGCSFCGVGFEKLQKLKAEPLKRCPKCNRPVNKVVGAPNISTGSPGLSEKSIESHGFTQYRKLEKGVYEKTAGKGPDLIRNED